MEDLDTVLKDPEYKKIHPLSIFKFRNVSPDSEIVIPQLSKNRNCTNVYCIIPVLLVVALAVNFSIYLAWSLDIERFFRGQDRCGNICGVNNTDVLVVWCAPKDFTHYPKTDYEGRVCVKKCEEKVLLNRCISENATINIDIQGYVMFSLLDLLVAVEYFPICSRLQAKFVKQYLELVVESLLYSIPTTIAITPVAFGIKMHHNFDILRLITVLILIVIVGFRCCTPLTFWLSVILMIILSIAITGFSWYLYLHKTIYILLAILGTFVMIASIVFLIAILLKSRHKLIVPLIAEASVVVFKIPVLLLLPLMTLFILLSLHGFTFYLTIAHFARPEISHKILVIFWILWLIALYLMHTFMNGFQWMVIAGSVAKYYFTKDKHHVGSAAFFKSFYITIRYHLGTVALGSMIITLLNMGKIIIDMGRLTLADGNFCATICFDCILCSLACMEEIGEYLAKQAYIVTAMHGNGLVVSGKRAVRLMCYFYMDLIMIDGFTYVAVGGTAVMVLFAALGIAIYINLDNPSHYFVAWMILTVEITLPVVYYYISLLNASLESMFLCFCEDKWINDGSADRPYFMSKRLESVVDKGMAIVKQKMEKRRLKREKREAAQRQ